jgi:hypothetical protein
MDVSAEELPRAESDYYNQPSEKASHLTIDLYDSDVGMKALEISELSANSERHGAL